MDARQHGQPWRWITDDNGDLISKAIATAKDHELASVYAFQRHESACHNLQTLSFAVPKSKDSVGVNREHRERPERIGANIENKCARQEQGQICKRERRCLR